jgi:pilus assembly protein Flp/PilA
MYHVNPNERLAHRTRQFGQGMTEYIIILVFVAIACVGAYSSFGTTVREQTAAVADGLAGINAPAVQAVPAAMQQGNAASQAPAAPAIAALNSGGSGQSASQSATVPYMAALSSAGSGQSAATPALAQLAMVAPPLTQGLIGGTNDPLTPFDDPCGSGSGSGAGAPCDPPQTPGDDGLTLGEELAGTSLILEIVSIIILL